jgi:hypothetical protein
VLIGQQAGRKAEGWAGIDKINGWAQVYNIVIELITWSAIRHETGDKHTPSASFQFYFFEGFFVIFVITIICASEWNIQCFKFSFLVKLGFTRMFV